MNIKECLTWLANWISELEICAADDSDRLPQVQPSLDGHRRRLDRDPRELFEEVVFLEYYVQSIKFVGDNKPMPLRSTAMPKDVLLARNDQGNYVRPEISAMWHGWKLAVAGYDIQEIPSAGKIEEEGVVRDGSGTSEDGTS